MLYLIDASCLIYLKNTFYPINDVPEFWEWLEHLGNQGIVKIPVEIYEEITDSSSDQLATWAKQAEIKSALEFAEEADVALVQHATDIGYAPDMNDVELEEVGRDPFLISYALVDVSRRFIVTNEVSKPGKKRHRTHIPNACMKLNVKWRTTVEFLHELQFNTSWREHLVEGFWPYVP